MNSLGLIRVNDAFHILYILKKQKIKNFCGSSSYLLKKYVYKYYINQVGVDVYLSLTFSIFRENCGKKLIELEFVVVLPLFL